MTQPTPTLPSVCCACGKTTGSAPTFGSSHLACVERILARQRRETTRPERRQTGASMVEYVMLLAFVAVLGIIGLRTIGPVAADMFDAERLGMTAEVPTQVLATTLERPVLTVTTTTIAPCQPATGMGAHPACAR